MLVHGILDIRRNELLTAMMRRGFPGQDLDLVSIAIDFASEVHEHQQPRANGNPYATHPLEVALIGVVELQDWDVKSTLVDVLHDTVEDSKDREVTSARISTLFGHVVHDDVQALTRMPGEKGYLHRIRNGNIRVQMTKAKDRLHNLRNPDTRDLTRFERKKTETRHELLPIIEELVRRLSVTDRWRGELLLRELTHHSRPTERHGQRLSR